ACRAHRLASLRAIVRTNRARFYSKAATRRGPMHNARNYSRRAEIQFAHDQQASARARPRAAWHSRALRTRQRQPTKRRWAQFGLAFDSNQPNNRLGGLKNEYNVCFST